MKKPIIYQPRASVLRGVQKQHTSRVLHDLDASSTLSFVRDGDKSTAHWTHNGTSHHIQVNEEMVCFIQHPDMLAKSRHRRKELQYLRAVHNHEVAHALYTSRDFKDINDRCKTEKVPFRDMNLFEDARIESLFRQRRPFAVGRKNDLDHEGNYSCEPYTYGVRKFEWLKWDVFNLENPRNAFLSFIKCEGTKKHLDSLETYWSSQLGLGGGFKSPNPKHTGTYTFDWFLKLWRKVRAEALIHVIQLRAHCFHSSRCSMKSSLALPARLMLQSMALAVVISSSLRRRQARRLKQDQAAKRRRKHQHLHHHRLRSQR